MIYYIKLTVISVIVRSRRFFDTTVPKQGPGAALLKISVTNSHEDFQEEIPDFQEVSRLLHNKRFTSVFTIDK